MTDEREGWVGSQDLERVDRYVHERTDQCEHHGCVPVHVTPLREGEPHPGETWKTVSGLRCKILSPPYDVSGCREVVIAAMQPNGGRSFRRAPVASLTPIPDEPEHEEWCPLSKPCTPGHCTCTEDCECERRSGEDRRQDDLLSNHHYGPTGEQLRWRRGDPGRLYPDERDGTDRRQS